MLGPGHKGIASEFARVGALPSPSLPLFRSLVLVGSRMRLRLGLYGWTGQELQANTPRNVRLISARIG
jgi:hypothetical protein